jgi:aminoglycoside phosphotransferase family enzyme
MLNRRLAPDLYEEVVAVNPSDGGLAFGNYRMDSIDYAIRMRRVDKKWEMAGMLERGEVSSEHVELIADQLAEFHQNAKLDKSLFNPIKELDEFGDIGHYADILISHIGATKMNQIMDGVKAARAFLRDHHQRFHYRRMLGFTVDGHGDLHAANVFLEHDKPLLFDCIEFNDEFRRVDVLDEVAFLFVDLEAAGRPDLAEHFAASYQAGNRTMLIKEDERLFDYYKCYRANVRLKVTAIKIDNLPSEAHAGELLARLHRYYDVYQKYADKLKA